METMWGCASQLMCAWAFVSQFLPHKSATGLDEYADGCRI
jgi:hypothetical protein